MSSPLSRTEFLARVEATVNCDRAGQYGSGTESIKQAARLIEVYTRDQKNFTSQDLCAVMILLKLARIQCGKLSNNSDSWVDIAGYASIGATTGAL